MTTATQIEGVVAWLESQERPEDPAGCLVELSRRVTPGKQVVGTTLARQAVVAAYRLGQEQMTVSRRRAEYPSRR